MSLTCMGPYGTGRREKKCSSGIVYIDRCQSGTEVSQGHPIMSRVHKQYILCEVMLLGKVDSVGNFLAQATARDFAGKGPKINRWSHVPNSWRLWKASYMSFGEKEGALCWFYDDSGSGRVS